VAGLNQITVLVDRSETELTEVGLNEWRPNLDGPPHKHDDKDQIFYISSGEGLVKVGKEQHEVNKGCLVYVPAGIIHQTITTSGEPLCYILFNIFNNPEKEGHASFADHIEKVKHIRKQQAESGKTENLMEESQTLNAKKSRFLKNVTDGKKYEFGSNTTILLLDRTETNRSEFVLVEWPAGNKGAMVAHQEKEQTFFVLEGKGSVTIGNETEAVKPGDIIFVPRNIAHTTAAGKDTLKYLCLNSMITDTQDKTFEEMYDRISPDRIDRWKTGNTSIGE
jgi:mannose-6-phosphate isomerase-like protein (cupin superfamily)